MFLVRLSIYFVPISYVAIFVFNKYVSKINNPMTTEMTPIIIKESLRLSVWNTKNKSDPPMVTAERDEIKLRWNDYFT